MCPSDTTANGSRIDAPASQAGPSCAPSKSSKSWQSLREVKSIVCAVGLCSSYVTTKGSPTSRRSLRCTTDVAINNSDGMLAFCWTITSVVAIKPEPASSMLTEYTPGGTGEPSESVKSQRCSSSAVVPVPMSRPRLCPRQPMLSSTRDSPYEFAMRRIVPQEGSSLIEVASPVL